MKDIKKIGKLFAKRGTVVYSLGIVAVIVVIYLLVKFIVGIEMSPEAEAWLNAPVSELKIWQLIAIVWFISFITSK